MGCGGRKRKERREERHKLFKFGPNLLHFFGKCNVNLQLLLHIRLFVDNRPYLNAFVLLICKKKKIAQRKQHIPLPSCNLQTVLFHLFFLISLSI